MVNPEHFNCWTLILETLETSKAIQIISEHHEKVLKTL